MKTLILGASLKPNRYSFRALNDLLDYGHEVMAIGNRIGEIRGVKIQRELYELNDIHTVTLYLNPYNQRNYINYILKLKPERVIFNPGTENHDFMQNLQDIGVEVVEGCTLVMLRTGQF